MLDRSCLQGHQHIGRDELSNILLKGLVNNLPVILSDKCFHGEYLADLQFEEATFRNCSFHKSNLTRNNPKHITRFRNVDLENSIFHSAKLGFVDFSNSKLIKVEFDHSDLSFANFSLSDLQGASFIDADLTGTIFDKAIGLNKDAFGSRILAEQKQEFPKASQIYLNLRNHFSENADHDSEAWAYYRYRVCKMNSYSPLNAYQSYGKKNHHKINAKTVVTSFVFWIKKHYWILWFREMFFYLLWGFAQKPTRTLLCSALTILLFALIYDKNNLVCYGQALCDVCAPKPSFFNSFLFSLASFSTSSLPNLIGSGNIAYLISSIQGILGVTFLALFTTSLASRLGEK